MWASENKEENFAPLINHNGVPISTHKFQGKESYISSQINMFVEEAKPKIPDGGWGWLVVLASFLINLISDGVSFTFGLLYIPFLEEFEATRSATSWIGSLFMAVPLLAGPIGSALVDKYGCKYMTVAGALICTLGFFLSTYARSIVVMYITFGVIGGLGLGLCYVTAVVSIAFWFEKRRTVALGLAASGTGLGTIIYSPLSTFLLSEYNWRGTVLIISGMFANMVVCGLLMRDPDWILEEAQINNTKSAKNSKRNSMSFREGKKNKNSQYFVENLDASVDVSNKVRVRTMVNLPSFLKRNEEVPLEVLKNLSNNERIYNVILENYPNLLSCKSNSDKGLNRLTADASLVTTRVPLRFSLKLKKTEVAQDAKPEQNADHMPNNMIPLMRSSSVNKAKGQQHGYLRNIRFRRNSMGYRGAMLNIHKYSPRAASCPDFFKNSVMINPEDEEEKWYDEFVAVLKDFTNFSLFLELHFLLMSLSTIILFTWFIVPYFYLADHMKALGYTEQQSSLVISVIGITNTGGMVLLGWIGDKINVTKAYAVCLIICGITLSCMMLFSANYIMLLIFSGLFGFWFASCFSLTPSILGQLVSLDDFTMAYGLFLLCQGIGNLTGPPLAGALFDLTQSYQQSFYQGGFWIVVSGLLIGAIPYTENRRLLRRKPRVKTLQMV